MRKSPNIPMRFTARNDYAFLSIVHPCTMERASFGGAETSHLYGTSGIRAASVFLVPRKIRTL